jgi:hypothetical protein
MGSPLILALLYLEGKTPTLLARLIAVSIMPSFYAILSFIPPGPPPIVPFDPNAPIISILGAPGVLRTLINSVPSKLYEAAPQCIMCLGEFTVENSAALFACGHSLVHTHEIPDECGGINKFLEAYERCPTCFQVIAQ